MKLETVNRRISIEMNESADALNNMRIKNKKLQDSTQDLRSKIKDLQMLVEKKRNEIKRKVDEIEAHKQDHFEYRTKQSDKHKEHVQVVTEKKVKLTELESIVESKDTIIDKLREQINLLNNKIAVKNIEKDDLTRQHDDKLDGVIKKKENSYFKLLDQLKSLQKELAEYRKVADECKAEVLRVKTHPATKATELYRESILLLNECLKDF